MGKCPPTHAGAWAPAPPTPGMHPHPHVWACPPDSPSWLLPADPSDCARGISSTASERSGADAAGCRSHCTLGPTWGLFPADTQATQPMLSAAS